MRKVRTATARWDESIPDNPGWVVDIEYADGERVSGLPPHPEIYHALRDIDPVLIIEHTLAWEGATLIEEHPAHQRHHGA